MQPGTSGRTQGERNDASPAAKATGIPTSAISRSPAGAGDELVQETLEIGRVGDGAGDVLVNGAVCGDQKSLRLARQSVGILDRSILVSDARVADLESFLELPGITFGILDVYPEKRQIALVPLGHGVEQGSLLFAGKAPRGPEIDHERLALEVLKGEGTGAIEPFGGESGSGVARLRCASFGEGRPNQQRDHCDGWAHDEPNLQPVSLGALRHGGSGGIHESIFAWLRSNSRWVAAVFSRRSGRASSMPLASTSPNDVRAQHKPRPYRRRRQHP